MCWHIRIHYEPFFKRLYSRFPLTMQSLRFIRDDETIATDLKLKLGTIFSFNLVMHHVWK